MDIFPRETQGTEGTEPESLETLLKNTNKHNPVPGKLMNPVYFLSILYYDVCHEVRENVQIEK